MATSNHDPRLWDDSDPLYAPGLKRRKRTTGPDKRIWIPREADVRAGYRPKSMPIPDDASNEEAAAMCRGWQRELVEWRQAGDAPRHEPGTWADVIHKYQTVEFSPYQRMQESTREVYDVLLREIAGNLGKRRVGSTTGPDLIRWYKNFRNGPRGDRPVYAKRVMQLMQRLARFAPLLGYTECKGVSGLWESLEGIMPGAKARKPRPTWKQICAFVEAADAAGRWSLGTATLAQYLLGQRQGDIIGKWYSLAPGEPASGIIYRGKRWADGLTWSDIKNWELTIAQNKSGGERILVFDLNEARELRDRLETVPSEMRVGPIIVSEARGRPYQRREFAAEFKKVKALAGWPDDLLNMDSRAGAATEAKDAGVNEAQGMAMTGHTTSSTFNRYGRPSKEQTSQVLSLRRDFRSKQSGND